MKTQFPKFIVLLALFSFSCHEKTHQSEYSITGHFTVPYDGYVFLLYPNVTDSVQVINKKFHFNGMISAPLEASISMVSPNSEERMSVVEFMLENSTISMGLTYNEMNFRGSKMKIIKMDSISGSKSHELKNSFYTKMEQTSFYKEKNDSIKSSILYKNLNSFIETNPKSVLSAKMLFRLPNRLGYFNSNQLEILFKKVDTNYQDQKDLNNLKDMIRRRKVLDIGAIPPSITLPNQNNELIDSKVLKSNFILYEFWASWCAPCREANPELIKVYEAYKNNGFEILGISIDENLADWKSAIKEDKIQWIQVIDTLGVTGRTFYTTTIPFNILLNKDREIIAKNMKPKQLRKFLSTQIK